MMRGHGRSHWDWAAATADALLGAVWVLFVWSVFGQVLRLALLCSASTTRRGPGSWPARSSPSSLVLLVWGYVEAMRVPRVRHVEVTIARLGQPGSTACGSC